MVNVFGPASQGWVSQHSGGQFLKMEMVSHILQIPEIDPTKPKGIDFPPQCFLSVTPKVPMLTPISASMREKALVRSNIKL